MILQARMSSADDSLQKLKRDLRPARVERTAAMLPDILRAADAQLQHDDLHLDVVAHVCQRDGRHRVSVVDDVEHHFCDRDCGDCVL